VISQGVYAKLGSGSIAAGTASVFAQVDFSHTITLGSIIVGLVVAGAAFLFTLRSRIATIWKQEAEGWREKAERLAQEVAEERLKASTFAREQQEIRHGLKDELAACRAELKVEQAKHDLTAVLERMQSFHSEAMTAMTTAQTAAVDSVTAELKLLGQKLEAGQAEQKLLLREIRDSVQAREE